MALLNWGSRFHIPVPQPAQRQQETPQTRAKGYWHQEQPASASLAASGRPRHLVRTRTGRTVAKNTSASSIACQHRLACLSNRGPAASLHHQHLNRVMCRHSARSSTRLPSTCGAAVTVSAHTPNSPLCIRFAHLLCSRTTSRAQAKIVIALDQLHQHPMRETLHEAHRANDSNRNGPTPC